MKSFKTKKGTVLPLLDLKGKDYLQVAYRIQWFREEHPQGQILTERISENEKHVTYRATISIPTQEIINDGAITRNGLCYNKLANADKTVSIKNTLDYEKCETAAIGRALALCGYGTQFANEDLSEGDELPDSPLENKKQEANKEFASPEPGSETAPVPPTYVIAHDEEFDSRTRFQVGKYTGKTLLEVLNIDSADDFSYAKYWLKNSGGKIPPAAAEYLKLCKMEGVF